MNGINLTRQRSLYTQAADRQLPALRREMAQLQEQATTGKRINRASDDAVGYMQARRLDAVEHEYDEYLGSIESAQLWMTSTQDALDRLANRYAEAYEGGLKAANDTYTDDDRESIAKSLESLKAEVVDTMNARTAGDYLFGGYRTQTAPFDQDGQPTVPYAALDGQIERAIGPGQRVAINVNAADLHQTGEGFTVIEAFDGLIAAVRSGDADDLKTAIGEVETARDHLADLGGTTGATASRLSDAADRLRGASLQVKERRSLIEDADILDVLSGVQRTQNSLEAALKVTGSVMQTSLLDYLR